MLLKSIVAQEFYNEYLELKQSIGELINERDYFTRIKRTKYVSECQGKIDDKVERLKLVLNQLKVVHGVSMEDLILLSIGIDV